MRFLVLLTLLSAFSSIHGVTDPAEAARDAWKKEDAIQAQKREAWRQETRRLDDQRQRQRDDDNRRDYYRR